MKRSQGCEKASMYRTYCMKRSQGCEKASMYRTYCMKRTQGCEKASMYRMYSMKRSQGCEKASMCRTYCMKRTQECTKASMSRMKRAGDYPATSLWGVKETPLAWIIFPSAQSCLQRHPTLRHRQVFLSSRWCLAKLQLIQRLVR